MKTDYENLEEEIQAKLREIARNNQESKDKKWTSEVKHALCVLGHNRKYDVYAAGCKDADGGEWLYDLVWSSGERDEMSDLPLVVECEWSTNHEDIKWDFGKLVASKSRIKLFVFQQADQASVVSLQKELERLIAAYKIKIPGERFLIAGYNYSEHEFIFHTVIL